jgi:hypothetical protein
MARKTWLFWTASTWLKQSPMAFLIARPSSEVTVSERFGTVFWIGLMSLSPLPYSLLLGHEVVHVVSFWQQIPLEHLIEVSSRL